MNEIFYSALQALSQEHQEIIDFFQTHVIHSKRVEDVFQEFMPKLVEKETIDTATFIKKISIILGSIKVIPYSGEFTAFVGPSKTIFQNYQNLRIKEQEEENKIMGGKSKEKEMPIKTKARIAEMHPQLFLNGLHAFERSQ